MKHILVAVDGRRRKAVRNLYVIIQRYPSKLDDVPEISTHFIQSRPTYDSAGFGLTRVA
jgi:hypothetical protein